MTRRHLLENLFYYQYTLIKLSKNVKVKCQTKAYAEDIYAYYRGLLLPILCICLCYAADVLYENVTIRINHERPNLHQTVLIYVV